GLDALVDDAWRRDDDSHAVAAVGGTDGALSPGGTDGLGQILIGTGFTVGDLQEALPDALLEGRAAVGERDVEAGKLAGEIAFELVLDLLQMSILAWGRGAVETLL